MAINQIENNKEPNLNPKKNYVKIEKNGNTLNSTHIIKNLGEYIDKYKYRDRFNIKKAIKDRNIDAFVHPNHSNVKAFADFQKSFQKTHEFNISNYLSKKAENKEFTDQYSMFEKAIKNKEEKLKSNNQPTSFDLIFKELMQNYSNLGYRIPSNLNKNIFQANPLIMENNKIADYLSYSDDKNIYDGDLKYLQMLRVISDKNIGIFSHFRRGLINKKELAKKLKDKNITLNDDISLIMEERKYIQNKLDVDKLKKMIVNNSVNDSDKIDSLDLKILKFDKIEKRKSTRGSISRFMSPQKLRKKSIEESGSKSKNKTATKFFINNDYLTSIKEDQEYITKRPKFNSMLLDNKENEIKFELNSNNDSNRKNNTSTSIIRNQIKNKSEKISLSKFEKFSKLKFKETDSKNEVENDKENNIQITSTDKIISQDTTKADTFYPNFRKIDRKITKKKSTKDISDFKDPKNNFYKSTIKRIRSSSTTAGIDKKIGFVSSLVDSITKVELNERDKKIDGIFNGINSKNINAKLEANIWEYLKKYMPEEYESIMTK